MEDFALQQLNKMLDLEEQGRIEDALGLSEQLRVAAGQDIDLLLEIAKLKFRNGCYKRALIDFVTVYEKSNNSELYDLILEGFYMPNRKGFLDTFRQNTELLEAYPHYYNSCGSEDPIFAPIWQDEEHTICVDLIKKQFAVADRQRSAYQDGKDKVAAVGNELWMEEILKCESQYRISQIFLDMDLPLYLIFDRLYWELFAQLYDLRELAQKNRIVFLVGMEAFCDYFRQDMVLTPQHMFFSSRGEEYTRAMETLLNEAEAMEAHWQAEIERYYSVHRGEILEHIRGGAPRILFFTTRFSTAIQYHIINCEQAAKRLGCETRLLIEPDAIHQMSISCFLRKLAEFKPDIIFIVDHFRFEYVGLEEIVWINWAQDPLFHVMCSATPARLTERDFVLNHFTTWKRFRDVGYMEKCLIDAPIPASDQVYKPYRLSREEQEAYGCDICFVCHAADVDSHISAVLCSLPEELHKLVRTIYKTYQSYVYETGEVFYEEEMFALYLEEAFAQHSSVMLLPETLASLTWDMYLYYNQRVYRQAMVDWIVEAGFTDVKLWGDGWKDSPKYEAYAMGPAQNGETLSKIYQASKIVLGNNILTTAAARAWETMLSGGFYMANYIPPESDVTDIRKIIEVDKDVVMFYDREDLIQKLRYYLSHEEERQEMIRLGRKAALENMTFDILMKRTLSEIGKRLEAQKNE